MKLQISQWLFSSWARRIGWVLGGIALLWALGWALVPPLLKSQAQRALGEALGRTVLIGQVDFKPWTLELTVADLSVAAAGASAGDKPALYVKQIYLDAELESLVRWAPVVDAIRVDGLALRVARVAEGRYDFDDILKRLSDRESTDEPRFAVYNVELRDASISLDDQPVGKVHEVGALHFTVPFLSNLASQRQIKVAPRLAFTFNGSHFDSSAEGTPFAQTRKSDLSMQLNGFELTPYLAYWPATAPVKLVSALLDADLHVAFEQTQSTSLVVTGKVQARGIKLDDYKSRELFSLDSIAIDLAAIRPLERAIHIAAIEMVAPYAVLRRDATGRIDLLPDAPAKPGDAVPEPNPPSTWKVQLDRLSMRSGRVAWQDESVKPAAQLGVQDLALEVKDLRWPFVAADQGGKGAAIEASLALSGARRDGAKGVSEKTGGTVKVHGQVSDTQVQLTLFADAVDLGPGASYVRQFLVPELAGQLDAEADLQWTAAKQNLLVKRLVLGGLALSAERTSLASVARLEMTGGQVDMTARNLVVSRVSLDKPKAVVSRGKDGHWMVEGWLRGPSAVPATTLAGTGAASAAAKEAPWGVTIAELHVADGALSFRDELPAKPVAVEITALKLLMRNLVPMSGQPTPVANSTKPAPATKTGKPSEISFSARLGHGSTEPGSLSYRGTLWLEPLATQGAADVVRLPAHAFEAYAADRLNIELLRADASFKGDISYAGAPTAADPGMRLKIAGDAALEEVRALALPAGPGSGTAQVQAEELLNWKVLSLRGLEVAMTPGSALQVDIAQTVLSDFFARVIIDPQGNINLQSLLKPDAAVAAAALPASGAAASVTPAAPAASAAVAVAATGAERPRISFGPISLVNGRAQFSDRFIQPNYSAALSELTGRLSAFSSTSAQMADLDLRGKAEATASLEISGKLNPLAQPLALDIKAKVRDLELSPLSPYAVKYAGYGIRKGKLSVDLAYLVKPDGELTATNKLVLNQLTFGDKVDGAPNSLPVKLAVALLADRHGVIDVDLPISGSLNDPQFKLGPIIFKVIVNLVVKAITAPFSLLAHAFGGGDELSSVSFDSGSAQLSDKAQQGLDKVAAALLDRPGLKMTVEGGARLEAEVSAVRRERVTAMVAVEKRRQLVLAGAKPADPAEAPLVSPAEYPELLSQVYRRSEVPKPLDGAGKPRELTHPEMEALLMSHINVDEQAIRELAQRRGLAVRDYLASRQVPLERLFLGPAKTAGSESNRTPRADLVLATR